MSGKIDVLTLALATIEANLDRELRPQDVADACHYSLSGLQKMFSHVFHMGLADYCARRRITQAARELLTTEDTVLDVALRYGYGSHEVFTRAFRRIWGETPSHFRRSRSFADIFPPYVVPQGGHLMSSKNFDIASLYDAIRRMDGTWAIVLDTNRLMEINNVYGVAAGDLAIAESIRRIDIHKQQDMLMFRIGGDEYILLTGYADAAEAAALADAILAHNGECIDIGGGRQLPIGMHHALTRLNADADLENGVVLRKLVGSSR